MTGDTMDDRVAEGNDGGAGSAEKHHSEPDTAGPLGPILGGALIRLVE